MSILTQPITVNLLKRKLKPAKEKELARTLE